MTLNNVCGWPKVGGSKSSKLGNVAESDGEVLSSDSLSRDFSGGMNMQKAILIIVRNPQTAKQLMSRDVDIKDDVFTNAHKAARNTRMNGQKYIWTD